MSLKYKIIEKKMVAYATILISCKNKFTLKNFTKNPKIITGIVAMVILRINDILFIILKSSFLKYIITAINDPVCVAILNKRF